MFREGLKWAYALQRRRLSVGDHPATALAGIDRIGHGEVAEVTFETNGFLSSGYSGQSQHAGATQSRMFSPDRHDLT